MARTQAAAIPPVLKISSFWDPKRGHLPEDWDRPCWKKECPASDGWQTFYFSLSDSYPIRVPTDPAAFPLDLMVHLDRDSQSIYDAYLLKSDITNNLNEFRRLQLLYNPQREKFVFVERFGRVGLVGHLSSPSGELVAYYCSNAMVDVFKTRFERLTGTKWEHRYLTEPVSVSQYPLQDRYIYVDQDYSRAQRVKLLDHEALTRVTGMHESTSLLLENILYGNGASKSSPCHKTINAPSVGSFTAPFHCLSIRTIAQAFQTLKRIANGNEKPRLLRWKTLVAASSCYRSQIPSWHGPDNSARPVVISNHYILFCELGFLHNLNPQNPPFGLEDFKNTVGHKGNPRAWAWGGVSRAPPPLAPLMQAYSSLPHGFHLLPETGKTALEFRELKAYLENSCQTHEHRMQFEIEGIYRVYTKAKLENPYHDWLRKTRDDQLPAAGSREPPRRNRLLLWHGTALTSLFGILEKGLQIYKRSTMFGDGIYLADASSKSANYCNPQRNMWSGPKEVYAILLLCEADVGSPSERHRSRHSMPLGHAFVQKEREREEDKRRRTEDIQGVGKVGPEGWKKVPWNLGWDWTGHDGKQDRGTANDYGDVWMVRFFMSILSSFQGFWSFLFKKHLCTVD
ncbi:hypothetical protein V8F33_010066 [Rhypophila sp. PSN 637]